MSISTQELLNQLSEETDIAPEDSDWDSYL